MCVKISDVFVAEVETFQLFKFFRQQYCCCSVVLLKLDVNGADVMTYA